MKRSAGNVSSSCWAGSLGNSIFAGALVGACQYVWILVSKHVAEAHQVRQRVRISGNKSFREDSGCVSCLGDWRINQENYKVGCWIAHNPAISVTWIRVPISISQMSTNQSYRNYSFHYLPPRPCSPYDSLKYFGFWCPYRVPLKNVSIALCAHLPMPLRSDMPERRKIQKLHSCRARECLMPCRQTIFFLQFRLLG